MDGTFSVFAWQHLGGHFDWHMVESVDGAHGICPPTTMCHHTLLSTQPKVDDNGTPPFLRPLLFAPSNCDKYYELLSPLENAMQVSISMIEKATRRIGYWRLANHPRPAKHVAPSRCQPCRNCISLWLVRMTFYYLILLLFLPRHIILYSCHPP